MVAQSNDTAISTIRTGSAPVTLRDVLQSRIDEGSRRAGSVLESIFRSAPTDRIARVSKLGFAPADSGLTVDVGGEVLTPSDWALGQISERAGVPGAYIRSLVQAFHAPATDQKNLSWRRDLAATILSRHFAHEEARVLVRTVSGQIRGFLSDKYRRLDSRTSPRKVRSRTRANWCTPSSSCPASRRTTRPGSASTLRA
jgi:hypothetical protein